MPMWTLQFVSAHSDKLKWVFISNHPNMSIKDVIKSIVKLGLFQIEFQTQGKSKSSIYSNVTFGLLLNVLQSHGLCGNFSNKYVRSFDHFFI